MEKNNLFSAPHRFKTRLLLPILVILFFYSSPLLSFAQIALSIGTAPTSETLEILPGEKRTGEIVVWNLSDKTTTYKILVRGFRQVENQPGTAIILTEEEDSRALYSASQWVKTDKSSIQLVPNKNEKIYYEIDVPEDATKGEYNVMIALISEQDADKSGTAAFAILSSGTPILLKIGSEFVENAELLEFRTDKHFYEDPTVTFISRIKNLGDTHISPVGEIVLTNIFEKEIARIPFNPNNQSILRDNSGTYEIVWDYGSFLTEANQIVLGPIKANLIVTYRNFQPGFSPLLAETSFWIIPWKYIVLIILTIVTIVILLNLRKRKKNQPQQLPK